jgi:transposase-like protein
MNKMSEQKIKPCYVFGPHSREFKGTEEEWNMLRTVTIPCSFIVSCPHCGSSNRHNGHRQSGDHKECQRNVGDGNYVCPGYVWG